MFEVYDIAILPIIIALVELVKRAGVSTRILPFIALALGIVAGIVYVTDFDLRQGIFLGTILGLSANGLHSGVKNVVEKDDSK